MPAILPCCYYTQGQLQQQQEQEWLPWLLALMSSLSTHSTTSGWLTCTTLSTTYC